MESWAGSQTQSLSLCLDCFSYSCSIHKASSIMGLRSRLWKGSFIFKWQLVLASSCKAYCNKWPKRTQDFQCQAKVNLLIQRLSLQGQNTEALRLGSVPAGHKLESPGEKSHSWGIAAIRLTYGQICKAHTHLPPWYRWRYVYIVQAVGSTPVRSVPPRSSLQFRLPGSCLQFMLGLPLIIGCKL